MDLGLDDYSSSSPELTPSNSKSSTTRPHDDSESDIDLDNFSIRTKSTVADVKIDTAPRSVLNQVQTTGPTVTKSNPITNSNTLKPVFVDHAEFDQMYHASKKESSRVIQERELRRKQTAALREKKKGLENDDDKDYDSTATLNKDIALLKSTLNDQEQQPQQQPKRRHLNLDADSETFTGSWDTYEGERENKQRVEILNQAKRQKQKEDAVDEYGNELDQDQQRQNQREAVLNTTSEVSIYYGKLPPQTQNDPEKYYKTESSSSHYVDFDYNTPEYLQRVIPVKAQYINNTPQHPNQIEKLKSQAELQAAIARKDTSTLSTPCFDSYNDILFATAFKTRRSGSTDSKETVSTVTSAGSNNNTEINPKGLHSFLEPPLNATPVDQKPFLLQLNPITIPAPRLNSKPYLDILSMTESTTSNHHTQSNAPFRSNPNGVSIIRFFPYTAQFLAAGHVDGSVKLYTTDKTQFHSSSESSNGLIRSYSGHSRGLTHFQWLNEGKRFLTCSHDGWVKLWDTETGKVVFRKNTTVGAFKGNATPMCAIGDDHQVTIGAGDGHITTYDYRSDGNTVIDYHQMQSTITTMCPVPTGSSSTPHFLTASADGQIRVYQHGIPAVYNHVTQQDPKMITRACVHPSEEFIIANTQANSAAIFKIDMNGKVKMNHKKSFTGHQTAGFSLGLVCSPDGEYLLSGDGKGKVVCWNFKKCSLVSKEQSFETTTSDVDWAWNSPMFAAASWSGGIKIFNGEKK